MSKCSMPKCDRQLLPHSKLKTCGTCRASMRRSLSKGVTWFINRMHKLELYTARTKNVRNQSPRIW